MTTRKQPPIQSITRAISILRCFTEKQELGLTEISNMVGLHKSTAAGIINTLKDEALIVQNQETGKLRLGIELYCLAVIAKMELGELVMPFLDHLLMKTNETVNLAVRDGIHVVYIEKKESPHSMRICTSVGKRLPLYCTAIGKVILAFMDEAEREPILDKLIFSPFTDKTITNKKMLLDALANIKTKGVAYDFEELESGLICIAAPVFDKYNRPIAAVSVSGPSIRMKESVRQQIEQILTSESRAISEQLVKTPIV